MTDPDVAERIWCYMQFRAWREGVEHNLSVEFYRDAVRQGCVSFFGVETEGGVLLADEERPDLFQEWLIGMRDE